MPAFLYCPQKPVVSDQTFSSPSTSGPVILSHATHTHTHTVSQINLLLICLSTWDFCTQFYAIMKWTLSQSDFTGLQYTWIVMSLLFWQMATNFYNISDLLAEIYSTPMSVLECVSVLRGGIVDS